MSLLSPRAPRKAVVVAAAATLVVGASLVTSATPAFADAMTIASVAPIKVAATLANRVVVITGTNFDEDLIGGITLGGDPDCSKLTSYVVTSSTSISVKTPGNGTDTTTVPGCAVSTGGTAETVTIYATDTTTSLVAKTSAVTFVPPPSLTALVTTSGSEAYPAYTENSSELTAVNRVKELSTAGGQVIRIRAGATFAFSGATTQGLVGTFDGKPLTTVGFLSSTGAAQGLTAAGDNNNYWIARTATALPASATPTLTITQNTVSRNFAVTEHGLTVVANPTVTSLDVTAGKVNAATPIKITGTGFSTTATDNAVTICGVTATVTAATATLLTLTTPTVGGVTPGLGTTSFSGVCPVVVTKGGLASPITAGSWFAFQDR